MKWYERISFKITAIIIGIIFLFSMASYVSTTKYFREFAHKVHIVAEKKVFNVRDIVSETLLLNGEEIMKQHTLAVYYEQLSCLERRFKTGSVTPDELIDFCRNDEEYKNIISKKFMEHGYITLSIYKNDQLILTYHPKNEIVGKNIFEIINSLSDENKVKQNSELFAYHWKNKKSGGIYFEQTGAFLPKNIPETMRKKFAYQHWGTFRGIDLVVETTTYIAEFQHMLEKMRVEHHEIITNIEKGCDLFLDTYQTVLLVVFIVIALITLGLIVFFNQKLIIKPVFKILETLKKYSDNEFSFKIQNYDSGEFGEIQKKSDEMAGKLNETLESLKDMNVNLENRVLERTEELKTEKEKSEQLLLNILPVKIAKKLKDGEQVIAEDYSMATVLFTDFKGFTTISETVVPERLVRELNEIFGEFDEMCEKYGMEKIKTIGDAYMACGGLPQKNETHPLDAVQMALAMIEFIEKRRKQPECLDFQIRIGIHTGPLIAGVIGKRKFTYDVWGDTVNIASRMESSGEPGKITVSSSTYNLIKEKFNCLSRGEMDIKGKGRMETFFVIDIKNSV